MKDSGKKKSALPAMLFLLLVAGGVVGGLYYTGKIDKFLDREENVTITPVTVEPKKVAAPVKEVQKTAAKAPVEKKVSAQPVAEDALSARYRAKFKEPKIGSRISVVLKSKKKMTGVVTHLDEKSLGLQKGKMTLTVMRGQLSSSGLARCYEDDYVKYMVAVYKRRKRRAEAVEESNAKLRAAYKEFLAKQGKNASNASEVDAEVFVDDADFKKYMEASGATKLIEERQKRIQAYEDERKKAGREY